MAHGGVVRGHGDRVGDMQIHLGGLKGARAKEEVDGGQGHTLLGQDTGEGVAELMAGEPDSCPGAGAIEQAADGGGGEGGVVAGEKDLGDNNTGALAEPLPEGGKGEGSDEDRAFDIALADDGEAGQRAGRGIEAQAVEGEVADLAEAEAAGEHEGEHGAVAGMADAGEETGEAGVVDIAREALRALDLMAAPDDGRGQRAGDGDVEEREEGGERGEATGDGVGLVPAREGEVDVGVDVGRGKRGERPGEPGADEFEIVWVVPGGGGVGKATMKPGGVSVELR